MKKADCLIAAYIVMMFFTNAYCQVHRWKDWAGKFETHETAAFMTGCATVAWPVYWVSRGTIYLVKQWPTVEVKLS